MRVCDTHEKCANVITRYVQTNVRATSECMYTPRRTHCSCYNMWTKPFKKLCQEKSNIHHFMTILTKKFSNSSEPSQIRRLHHSMSVLIFLLVLVPSVGFSSVIASGGFSRLPEACVSERPS